MWVCLCVYGNKPTCWMCIRRIVMVSIQMDGVLYSENCSSEIDTNFLRNSALWSTLREAHLSKHARTHTHTASYSLPVFPFAFSSSVHIICSGEKMNEKGEEKQKVVNKSNLTQKKNLTTPATEVELSEWIEKQMLTLSSNRSKPKLYN